MMQREASHEIIEINPNHIDVIPSLKKNTVIKDIRYIPFFSKEPIGTFDEVKIYKNRLIVLDAFTAGKVFIFDMSGNLLH
ncbi:MAG: 6-bladed beta-propeller, partial [Tannerella sp.]|nr:6-bladed beta-propeller [Tannerella sp.]